jgi:hypothetical protein
MALIGSPRLRRKRLPNKNSLKTRVDIIGAGLA